METGYKCCPDNPPGLNADVIGAKSSFNNINSDSGIEIPEAWMPAIKKRNNRKMVQQ